MSLLLATAAFAQNSNSSLSGFVQDTTKANVPGVTVTATNTDTGVAASVLSNDSGTYNFLSLLPGTYKLTAELTGFRPSTIKDVHLGSNETLRLNITMQVGTESQAVDVTAQLDTAIAESSASIGQVLSGTKVRDLPLLGNDVLDLITTMGGVRGGAGSTATTFAGIGAGAVQQTVGATPVAVARLERAQRGDAVAALRAQGPERAVRALAGAAAAADGTASGDAVGVRRAQRIERAVGAGAVAAAAGERAVARVTMGVDHAERAVGAAGAAAVLVAALDHTTARLALIVHGTSRADRGGTRTRSR